MSLGPAEILVLLATVLAFASRRSLEAARPALTRASTRNGGGGGRRVRLVEGST